MDKNNKKMTLIDVDKHQINNVKMVNFYSKYDFKANKVF